MVVAPADAVKLGVSGREESSEPAGRGNGSPESG